MYAFVGAMPRLICDSAIHVRYRVSPLNLDGLIVSSGLTVIHACGRVRDEETVEAKSAVADSR